MTEHVSGSVGIKGLTGRKLKSKCRKVTQHWNTTQLNRKPSRKTVFKYKRDRKKKHPAGKQYEDRWGVSLWQWLDS